LASFAYSKDVCYIKSMQQLNEIQKKLGRILKPYKTMSVVGGNWGDEGKGKIIDLVMKHYDMTVRFSGGANAGHTVKTDKGVKIVSHLIPCGLAQNKICVMGRGELVNIELFLEEMESAKKTLRGKMPQIWLDEMSPLWTPWHAALEVWLEMARGKKKVGTTGKGIGPLEGLYKLRISPVVGQIFLPKEKFTEVLKTLYLALLPIFEEMKKLSNEYCAPTPEAVAESLRKYAKKLKGHVADTGFLLDASLKKNKRILFEGAQALGLDNRWGTYPFVTSGECLTAGASVGSGLSMDKFQASIMVAKTLPTRVGAGPFVSEMWERQLAMDFAKTHIELFKDEIKKEKFLSEKLLKINQKKASFAEMSQYFQVLGDERGATTGRGRSVGFLDIPWLIYAIRINNPNFIALTRFDMLSKVKSIPVVASYKYKNKILPFGKLPPSWELENVKPVFEQWPCFLEDISGANSLKDLPKGAKDFLNRLEDRIKKPILLVGTGPGRGDIVIRG
jgi:adenylosuccinate synthase